MKYEVYRNTPIKGRVSMAVVALAILGSLTVVPAVVQQPSARIASAPTAASISQVNAAWALKPSWPIYD